MITGVQMILKLGFLGQETPTRRSMFANPATSLAREISAIAEMGRTGLQTPGYVARYTI
jgi:hypothetical protein